MSAPYSNLETKLEAAAAAVHDGAGGYVARTGIDDREKHLPAVLFHVERGAEAPLNSGNYHLTLTVTVMDDADRVTKDAHRQGSAAVFDVMLDDNITELLSDTVEDFTIQMVTGRDGSPTRVEDRQWISEISLNLYGCATDLV